MLPRHYQDLTGTERENVIKKRLIDHHRKQMIKQEVQQDKKEFVENADLESKKKRYIDVFDQYTVMLQQTLDYFALLPHALVSVTRFVNVDRVARFYDNNAKLTFYFKQLIDLLNSIFKELPVDDSIYKKLKKRNETLQELYDNFVGLFQPRLVQDDKVTDFNRANMVGVNEDEISDRVYDIIDDMNNLQNKMNDVLTYLESTPRSGKGMKWNIDTTEYIIPAKYL